MKRYSVLILILLLSVVLTGCGLAATPTPYPTYTPLPTYTPFPTFTPPPTATATFLPSPTTLPPTETPTATPAEEGEDGGAAPSGASSGSELEVTLAFFSNLREGPGQTFDIITTLNAGELLVIEGRDFDGNWLLARTVTGTSGWIRLSQFAGLIEVARVPMANEVPTPAVTFTPTGDAVVTTTGTPGTPAATQTPQGAVSGSQWEVVAGGTPVCASLQVGVDQPFGVTSTSVKIVAFESDRPDTVQNVVAYQVRPQGVPAFITPYVQGDISPANCTDNVCTAIDLTLCATALGSAPTGFFDYDGPVQIAIGEQNTTNFSQLTTATIQATWRVIAAE